MAAPSPVGLGMGIIAIPSPFILSAFLEPNAVLLGRDETRIQGAGPGGGIHIEGPAGVISVRGARGWSPAARHERGGAGTPMATIGRVDWRVRPNRHVHLGGGAVLITAALLASGQARPDAPAPLESPLTRRRLP